MTASVLFFFFFNDTATTEIYTLSLHDALPICMIPNQIIPQIFEGLKTVGNNLLVDQRQIGNGVLQFYQSNQDRKSTRLNSSHQIISYAVFCLKKKKYTTNTTLTLDYNYNHSTA